MVIMVLMRIEDSISDEQKEAEINCLKLPRKNMEEGWRETREVKRGQTKER